jgi:SAM-dependent methyltransferase
MAGMCYLPRSGMDRSPQDRLAREISHHRKIAPFAEAIWSWASPSGRARADRRAQFFVDRGQLAPGCRALELGCGTGVFLERVAASGAKVSGVDLSSDLILQAREKTGHLPNVSLVLGNAELLPFRAGQFDVVYGSSMLHHVQLEVALREALRVLRPGGRIVFAEPNAINPQLLILFNVHSLRERFGVSPDELAFSRFRARAALRGAGFVHVTVEPYDFLHPSTPARWIRTVARLSLLFERLPLVREIAGSLLMCATKPGTPA